MLDLGLYEDGPDILMSRSFTGAYVAGWDSSMQRAITRKIPLKVYALGHQVVSACSYP